MNVKGVIVAAGYGTRFLPVTRCVPKEMLPLVDRPAIDFVVEEMVSAGISEILVISSRRKKVMEDWFDRDPELEGALTASGKALDPVRPPAVKVTFVRQQRMGGTGDALRLAREFAGDDPVVVAYPDDLFPDFNPSQALIRQAERTGRSGLCAVDLGGCDVSRFGVLDVDPQTQQLRRIVEKPPRGTEPSTLVSLGRYLFMPEFFTSLEEDLTRHTAGEFFHIGAIQALAETGRVDVVLAEGTRYDTGTPQGYLEALVDVALRREDVGPGLRAWLVERLQR